MRRSTTATLAGVALLPLIAGTAAPALAAGSGSGDVTVTNTETVQASLDASGVLKLARVYEQLDLSGHGTASIANPVSTSGLRNLDGFGRYTVSDGSVLTTLDVDGQRRLRSVSDYTKDLPLAVKVTYTLDGKTVDPGDVVGRSGTLEVHYTVTNTTGRQQDVSYDDGTGTTATTSAETVVPMIGQLVTTLPASFSQVRSAEAATAGDGHGGTRLTFQMTLFPPIGSATAEFGYTARISHGVVPPATITSLPVSPLDYPSFKAGSASYAAGATSGVDLTSGAIQIDSHLLELRDGAAQLLDGLLQLRDGANQLSSGLNDDAAPGAAQLAAGADRLAAGLAEARGKAPQLTAGLSQVSSGLAALDAGLRKMYGDIGALPTNSEVKRLVVGIDTLQAKIGSTATADTLLYGVDQLRQQVGVQAPLALAALAEGVYSTDPAEPGAYQQLGCAITVLTDLIDGAAAGPSPCYSSGRPPMAPATGVTAIVLTSLRSQLQAGLAKFANPAALGDPNDPAFFGKPASDLATANMQQVLTYLQGRLANVANPGLTKIECGISSASLPGVCDSTTPGVLEAVVLIDGGVDSLLKTVVGSVQGGVGGDSATGTSTLRGGVHSLQGGVAQLGEGGSSLVSGLSQLGAGAKQLDAGAEQLADGLEHAAAGSTQLADGLATAADGAPGLVDGAQQLSDEGTSQLVGSGEETASDYGVKYAVLRAGAERAQAEGMAYGAPEGALGATAYSIDIEGVDGSGVTGLGRGIAAVALFALGAGIATLVRRRLG